MRKASGRRDSSGSDASTSRIPVSYTPTLPRRNLSRHPSTLSLRTNGSRGDDGESVCSVSSCEHNHFAKNGSTYSGRNKKYIVHCSPQHTDPDDYLTPTQRANATIRKLKSMLSDSRSDVATRDDEIARLSRELVQLRLDHSTREGESPERVVVTGGSPRSLSDSGHFEELSPEPSLSRNQISPYQAYPSSSIDALLHKLAEANERYEELKPQYEELSKRFEIMEFEKAELEAKFEVNEENHRKTYLEMFRKGQEAARFQAGEEGNSGKPEGTLEGNIPKLLKELEVTKAELESVRTMYRKLIEANNARKPDDAEITLNFLKSAFYYFLTDRENTAGHLSAIQSILGFTPDQRQAIDKAAYTWK